MRKYTQKELREYIRLKLARDLTTVDPEELPRHYEKIGYSRGIYGLNGGLVQDKDTGELGPLWAVLLISSGCSDLKGVYLCQIITPLRLITLTGLCVKLRNIPEWPKR